jgi:hypothetical protein
LTLTGYASVNVSNFLSDEKKQQVIALGRLGWPLRRIEQAPGCGGKPANGAAKPAIEVATDPAAEKPPDLAYARSGAPPGPSLSLFQCLRALRDLIELGLSRGRNAMAIWPDLVNDHGFPGPGSALWSLSSVAVSSVQVRLV